MNQSGGLFFSDYRIIAIIILLFKVRAKLPLKSTIAVFSRLKAATYFSHVRNHAAYTEVQLFCEYSSPTRGHLLVHKQSYCSNKPEIDFAY